MLVADYPFLDLMLTMLVFFGWVIWITVLIMVLYDNFNRPDHRAGEGGVDGVRHLRASDRRARLHRHPPDPARPPLARRLILPREDRPRR